MLRFDRFDSFRLVQPNHSNHSNNDCDWLISGCFMGVQLHSDDTSVCLENEVCFKKEGKCVGK